MKNNTIKIQIVLLLLLFVKSSSAQTWEKINPVFPLNDTLGSYARIAFANKDTGWIYTSLQVIQPSGEVYKKLFRTTDGGESWEKKISNTGAWDIYRIYVNKPDFLFILYEVNKILITTNGGDSWDSSKINENLQSSIEQIHFFNNKNAIALNNYRWFSSDGGYTWNKGGDTITIFPNPTDLYFLNDSLGWIVSNISDVTDVGSIANTTDGGKNWQYQDKRAPLLYGVYFIDSLKGFAVGTNHFFPTGYIYKTEDGGLNWEADPFPGGPFWCIEFLDSLNGWVGGRGTILSTTDGGNTWEIQIDTIEADFNQMIILKEDKIAYVLGDDWNGVTHTLLRADLSNIVNVTDEKNELPNEYFLLNNYPNPFNPTTNIEFRIANLPDGKAGFGFVTLKVYDVLGREIATLINEDKSAGTYSVNFDASNLPDGKAGLASGIYFYSITAGKFSQTKKMILAK